MKARYANILKTFLMSKLNIYFAVAFAFHLFHISNFCYCNFYTKFATILVKKMFCVFRKLFVVKFDFMTIFLKNFL